MDRKRQLGNVSFGGDWSENILVRETNLANLAVLRAAVEGCRETDPASAATFAALDTLTKGRARGALLAKAFRRAASQPLPELRETELRRVLWNIEGILGLDAK